MTGGQNLACNKQFKSLAVLWRSPVDKFVSSNCPGWHLFHSSILIYNWKFTEFSWLVIRTQEGRPQADPRGLKDNPIILFTKCFCIFHTWREEVWTSWNMNPKTTLTSYFWYYVFLQHRKKKAIFACVLPSCGIK